MGFAAIIVGDEILSGRREDKHLSKTIGVLRARGLELAWAQYIGDDRERLTQTLRRSLAGDEVVFSFGGIGVTPDDHTRQAAAAAAGVAIELHPDAEREIRARFGDQITPQRLKLGEFPQGCEIIPNPYNRIPGFSLKRHHFLPGFPIMAWPMMEWLLDTCYRDLHHAAPHAEGSVRVFETYESALLDLMHSVELAYADVKVFSLPCLGGNGVQRHIELGVKGDSAQVAAALAMIRGEIALRGLPFEDETER
jgi:molybdopterin-biosynthesis enzyme MoeA-like protein